ncbi:hypothetical protein ACJRO7_017530 [Eucalyptus globulus]|uniref:Sulfite exporter TauE/SafE family protein n=1 Tax=Eucalyptus globulus TaxID=34317 RepID=A0ABD3KUS1_EUCGL
MKNQRLSAQLLLSAVAFFVFFFTILSLPHAKGREPISGITKSHDLSNQTHRWRHTQMRKSRETRVEFKSPAVLAGALCFIASAISSAGGIGGGGLFIPILAIVAGLELKMASSFSAFMVTGVSLANVVCSLTIKNPKFGGRCLIDYDIALLSVPCMLLGVGVGVMCHVIFPEWFITILFAVFLAWSTFKTCEKGVSYWKLESEEGGERVHLENGFAREGGFDGSEEAKIAKEPLLRAASKRQETYPWMKLVVLVLVWFSFFFVYILRGNRHGQSIISIEPCGPGYWILSSVQIPLAVAFTSWILFRKERLQHQVSSQQDIDDQNRDGPANRLIFPVMALLAGLLGGFFGIGGGMLISPLLLQVGIVPEVTAATCSFMVFFSSTMSALQYILLGMEHTEVALLFSFICFVASLLGIIVVQRVIREYGRASLIVFSVSTVMALSTVLITGFGAVKVWKDYISGKYMGFKSPC